MHTTFEVFKGVRCFYAESSLNHATYRLDCWAIAHLHVLIHFSRRSICIRRNIWRNICWSVRYSVLLLTGFVCNMSWMDQGCPILILFFKCPLDNFPSIGVQTQRTDTKCRYNNDNVYYIRKSMCPKSNDSNDLGTHLWPQLPNAAKLQAASTAVSESDGRILDGVSIRFFECCRPHWMSSMSSSATSPKPGPIVAPLRFLWIWVRWAKHRKLELRGGRYDLCNLYTYVHIYV